MIALAAAVSVDYDYFSQHSHGSGWFAPMMFPPVPYPSGGGAEGGATGGEEGAQGEAVPGDAGKHALCAAGMQCQECGKDTGFWQIDNCHERHLAGTLNPERFHSLYSIWKMD